MVALLQPGAKAPAVTLNEAGTGREVSLVAPGSMTVVVFVPGSRATELAPVLSQLAAGLATLGSHARLLAVSEGWGREHERPAGALAVEDTAAVAARFGSPEPGVFVLDENGTVRRVYDSEQYPDLPNPAMVVRATRKLADTPAMKPVTPGDWQLGPAGAPVVLTEYSDYECGPCGELHHTVEQLLATHGHEILLVHRHLPLRTTHHMAQDAAEAAEAAGAQGRFWEMHHLLFEACGSLDPEQLLKFAGEIGLDVPRFREALESHTYRDAVNEDLQSAVRNGIKLPPALFINGVPVEGARTLELLRIQVEAAAGNSR